MKTIGITGGSGFIGSHLTERLVKNGYDVVIFTRSASGKPAREHIRYALWDPSSGKCDIRMLQRVDTVVNLAGAGIADRRWTTHRKKEIVQSRVDSTRFLIQRIREHTDNCRTFISASAIGYYGPDRDVPEPFTESAPSCDGFLAETCRAWEEAAGHAGAFARTVIFRFGIVLGKDAGAFRSFVLPQRFGLMPVLGSGSQVISWIHIDDLSAMIQYVIEHTGMSGVYNAVAPEPVSSKQLMKTIAAARGGVKIPVPVPAVLLRLALGEMSAEVLKSVTVSSGRIRDAGFRFQYGTIGEAVRQLMAG